MEAKRGKIKVGVWVSFVGKTGVASAKVFACNVNLPAMYKHLPKLLNCPGEDEIYRPTGYTARNVNMDPCPRDRVFRHHQG
jgi:hypothetical protein